MTQADLARACGLTVSAIKAYENGRRRPSIKAISALYRALGLDAFEVAALYMEVQNDGA
jgi:transcriptional regulator with XRE-family HTH domain